MSSEQLLKALVEGTAKRLEELAAAKGLTYVNERDHQSRCFVAALRAGLPDAPYREAREGERQVSWPDHWPRVGDVDALLVPLSGTRPTFVELKCGSDSKALRACGWDAVKCALAVRLGDAGEAYLLGATTVEMWAKEVLGSGLFSAHRLWRSDDVRQEYKRAFVDYEKCDDPPPTVVPESFDTQLMSRAEFGVAETRWELRLTRVTPSAHGWFAWKPFLSQAEKAAAREWRRSRGRRG